MIALALLFTAWVGYQVYSTATNTVSKAVQTNNANDAIWQNQ